MDFTNWRIFKMDKNNFSYLDLLVVIILTIFCIVFFLVPLLNETVVRTVLGLLLIVVLPGYALIALIFPRKSDLDLLERGILIIVMSICITSLTGFFLNYSPWGIHIKPMLFSLAGTTFLLCALTLWRRNRIPAADQLRFDFHAFNKNITSRFKHESRNNKILSIILIFTVGLALSSTAYVIADQPKLNETYTQFYILGSDGKASDYPTSLYPYQQGNLTIGIVNHEYKKTAYHLLVISDDQVLLDEELTLNNNEKIEIPFNFTVGEVGVRRMNFFLYKLPDNSNVYRSLNLWLNVTEPY